MMPSHPPAAASSDNPLPAGSTAPWLAKRKSGKRGWFRRSSLTLFLFALLGLIVWGMMPRPIEIETGEVRRGALTVHVVEEGKTRVRNRYVLSAPVAGQMRRVLLKAGDPVTAGETLITAIDAPPASLLDPRTEAQGQARVAMMSAAMKQAAQNLELARTAAKFAESQWARMSRLGTAGGVSTTDRDNAERDALMRAREVHSAEFSVKVAEYEWEQAKAALANFDQNSSNQSALVEVKSPVSGRILKVMQESAVSVTPGTPIVEIGDPADIEIEAEILSRDAVAIQPGAAARIEQWGAEPALEARVRRVEPAAFTKISALGVEEQRVIVLSDLVNPPPAISALGDRYRVEVRVAIWQRDDVLQVPAGALFREGNTWKTFVYKNGKAHKQNVETGRTDGRQTEVIAGLEQGMLVLVHPPDAVKDGMDVRPRRAP